MKILLIHQAFVSGQEAGGTRHFELGQRLREYNDTLIVVASQVSYQNSQRFDKQRSGLFYRDEINGVEVLRAYTIPVLHRNYMWRVLAFVIFSFTSVWAGLRAGSVDIVMGTTPPIFQAFSAWLVAAIRRKPFFLEVRDLWPEFAIDMGVLRNPLLIRIARWGEGFLYTQATHILVNSPAYREYLLTKGIPLEKVSVVANGVEVELFDPNASGLEIRQRYGLEGKFLLVYAGAHGQANDLEIVLRAAQRLCTSQEIHFMMVGDGTERSKLVARSKEMGLDNITFVGALPKADIPSVLAAADVCLATLMNIKMFNTTYPNKVFDYMAAGRPTLLAIDGVIRQVIEQANGGVFVPPGDDVALASMVARLANEPHRCREMGRNAREYVARHFDRKQQAAEFRTALWETVDGFRDAHYLKLKRAIDFCLASVCAVVLSPLLLLLSLGVLLTTGTPILFRQERAGLQRKPFTVYKFRTMTNARNKVGQPLPDDLRLTKFGSFLRSTSLDELPELFNILHGDMGFVGPRPLLMQYLERYTPEQARRHEVKPGITGWAQVNGRNSISWEEKFVLDVWYIDNHSLLLDLKIIALTFWKVVKREGISQAGEATMSEFMGSSE